MPEDTISSSKKASVGNLVYSIIFEMVFPVLLMWLAGNLLWAEGLVFSFWFMTLCLPLTIWLFVKNPSLFMERVKPGKKNQKQWDRIFVSGLVLLFFGWIAVLPLDGSRFHWSPAFPAWLEVMGAVLLVLSAFLFIKCYVGNPYLSSAVRIQDDRGQKVISTGVYGFVRHPMYLAGILLFFGAPMLMGSLYGFAFSIVFTAGIVYRIFGEEKMLQTELEGYTDYKKKVRYRLLPFLW